MSMVFFLGWEMGRPSRLGLDVVGGDVMSFWTVRICGNGDGKVVDGCLSRQVDRKDLGLAWTVSLVA